MSLSRSFGTCIKGGTCFTCSSLSCSTLFLSSIERFMNAIGDIGLIESQCKISGRRLPSLSAPQNRARMQHRRPLDTPPCVFPLLLLFFSSSSSAVSPVDTPRWAERVKRKWKGEGSISLPSRGQLPGPSSPALKNLSTRNHECLLATSCVSVE